MIIYNYDKTTKEFLFASDATLNPEESRITGTNVYLMPAFSTTQQPPELQTHQAAIFNESTQEWSIVEDYRELYQTDLKTRFEEITKLGPIAEGCTLATREQILQIYADSLYYVIEDGQLIENPHYDEDKAEKERQEQIDILKQQLVEIDTKKVRSTSAIALGIATQDDIDYLTNLEAQAEKIREEIRRLQECH